MRICHLLDCCCTIVRLWLAWRSLKRRGAGSKKTYWNRIAEPESKDSDIRPATDDPDLKTKEEFLELKDKFVDVGGARTRYLDVGKGEPTILIHGGGPGAYGLSNYRKNVEPLAGGRRVIVFDLPGYGQTENKLPDGSIWPLLGEFTRQFMDAIGVQKASFVGNSLGGMTSLAVALQAPQRVNKLVLMGTGGSLPVFSPTPTEGIRRMASFYAGSGPSMDKLKGVVEMLVFDPSVMTEALLAERLEAAKQPGAINIFVRPPREIWRENLSGLEHKTLLIWGREDRVVPLDSSFLLLKTMPNAQLHVFPKCGHWAQWEKADEFNKLVADFLDRE
jgi:4,5:9,10-diseco-3-hydroxy-5,9,17-trioxoandrosta-1(10),2-diene-4-oate hydrolase